MLRPLRAWFAPFTPTPDPDAPPTRGLVFEGPAQPGDVPVIVLPLSPETEERLRRAGFDLDAAVPS